MCMRRLSYTYVFSKELGGLFTAVRCLRNSNAITFALNRSASDLFHSSLFSFLDELRKLLDC